MRAFVGLGANLGDAAGTLGEACKALELLPHTTMRAVSNLYRTAPIEASGPDFINAVAELFTLLEPLALLDALQTIETAHGRQRPYRNAPRTLDLDLLLYGDLELNSARLSLPHPRLQQRAFVLLPLLELAPDLEVPGLGPLQSWLVASAGQAVQAIGPIPGRD